MTENNGLLGACGLLCSECDLYLARDDHSLRRRLAEDFREEHGVEIDPDWLTCGGCFAPGEQCWSPDCKIRKCCEVHEVTFCSECPAVPCQTLLQWASGSERYSDALRRTLEAHRLIKDTEDVDELD